MKVIDKTPLQNEKGEFGPLQRLQGVMEHGPNWFKELEAQKTIITQLDTVLEKGFTLIRNLTLEHSQIIEPLILVGPPGVIVIHVTHLSGFYEAKGDQWNVVNNGRSAPAPINLMLRVARLARALQVYLERQGVNLPGPIEPVLMASNPEMHIESLRPAVRVIMSDAVRQFGISLLQARPILNPQMVLNVADRIITPGSKATPLEPEPEDAYSLPPAAQPTQTQSRARVIFHAAEESKPFDPTDLSFAYDETAENEGAVPQNLRETSPSQRLPSPVRRPSLSGRQVMLLGAMLLVECCVMGVFAYLILSSR